MLDLKKILNEEQYVAATAPDGAILVLAAAGTGKTRTLVYRMAWLVEDKGVTPDRVLLLTFTNKAAREMLERANEVIGTGIAGIWGGTFHHMANRILRRYGRHLGYPPDFPIIDRDDARTIVGQSLKELKLNSKDFLKKDVLLSLFGTGVNSKDSLEDIVYERYNDSAIEPSDVLSVHKMYEKKKRELNAMDFDDLLVNCLRLFKEQPRVLEQYQEKFLHILVDEYQDTNPIQAELIDCLAARNGNIFVVGDDFQCIYSWRGADFRNIMSFPERYPNASIHKLETNYRSVPEVLAVANACIAGNPEQFQKELKATREAYKKPRVAMIRDGYDQARYVVRLINELIYDGCKASEIAVLYRAHFHSMELQLELSRAKMPHVITSGLRFFEQKHVKDVCSVVKLVASPSDELSFRRLLELLPRVGERTAIKVWQKLGSRFDVMNSEQREIVRSSISAVARPLWDAIEPVLTDYVGERTGRDAGEIIARFLAMFYKDYAVKNYDNAERRIDDIKELMIHAGRCETIEAFLSDMALLTNTDTAEKEDDFDSDASIRLSTVHQAKGLEWSVVIILWASEGMFPSPRSVDESIEGEAEERRLFYVAVTRAKDDLIICAPEMRRMRDGGVMFHDPSRFVTEIPQGLLQRAYS
ncbi:MAG: ATP-dependent helicase [Kiritimatiellae bacterium]|nr:ATP-dependent helicase [Kiritimatiellia bacterium]